MGGYRRPGPLCSSVDGFDLGTLALCQSPIPGPLCSIRLGSAIAEAILMGNHNTKSKVANKPRKHHHVRLKPNAKVMAVINAELATKINFDKLADFEGGQQLQGYIPGHTIGVKHDGDKVAGKSGVTIATGFDIGQWSISDLSQRLSLSMALKKYERFCNKRKQAAIDELEKCGGLYVEKIEADETDMKIQRFHLIAAMASWDEDPKPFEKFTELTSAQQTVILSRTYHQGIGMPDTTVAQDFYSAAQKGDWIAAEKALRNYNVLPNWYKTRVHQEADLLANDLRQNQDAQSPALKVPS
jgi:hypothetical protein